MMNEEELKKYREFIQNMSSLEREEYFRKLASNEITVPLTGYPHLDRMWLKYYDKDFLKEHVPEMTITDYMKSYNKEKTGMNAISYFGKHIKYYELYEHIDEASKVLKALGGEYNDRVMNLMANIPETAYLFYGASQLGMTSDYVDPRPDSVNPKISASKTLQLIQSEKAKYIIALDQCYLAMLKPIENELKELGIDNIVIVKASDSMDFKAQMNYLSETANFEGLKALKSKLAKMKKIDEMVVQARSNSKIKTIDYKDLVSDSRYVNFTPASYDKDHLDLIVHTSGTTGSMPKAIPLSTLNLNSYVEQTRGANMPMACGDRVLHMLPYFAAYGVVDVTHSGLFYGCDLVQVPEFAPSNLGKMILKYKPQIIMGPPSWFLGLLKDPALNGKDLSFLKMVSCGGDVLEVEDEIKLNKFLESHNASIKMSKGHGMSETSGCGSNAILSYNDLGSMGIPMPRVVYGVVNPETKELLRFDENTDKLEGELIVHGNTITSGVLDGKEIVPHITYDGMDFIYTRDIASMDKRGVMQFLTRSDRSFTRYDGFKVKPYVIENIIKSNDFVKYCVISPVYDEKRFGNIVMASIVLEDGINLSNEEKVEFVKELISKYFIENDAVSSRQIPYKVRFRDNLVLSNNSKNDFNAIAKEGLTGDEITIELEETNISVGSIKIIPPKVDGKQMIRERKIQM